MEGGKKKEKMKSSEEKRDTSRVEEIMNNINLLLY